MRQDEGSINLQRLGKQGAPSFNLPDGTRAGQATGFGNLIGVQYLRVISFLPR